MKVRMLGRDITVTREALLSDGYCLSTVKHAERLASGPETYTVTEPQGESGGAAWLRGHIPYCTQCQGANSVKVRITEYIGRHFPSRIVDWNQGRMPKAMMGQIVSSLMRSDREFMAEALGFAEYNKMPLHLQAIFDREAMARAARDSGSNELAEVIGKARVVLVDTDVLFEAWQLLGSSPLYEKKRLMSDFEKMNVMTPFQSTYLAFSEGINQHLIEHFFDNMPVELFGNGSIKGVLFYRYGTGRCSIMQNDILADNRPDGFVDNAGHRNFLWVALLRAIQDKVFAADLAPEFTKDRDQYLSGSGPRRTKAPEPFYAVRVNPNRSFRDPGRTYGKRHINWTHRWDVSGHWRTYQDGRRVWIASYIKGPEGKPFVPSVRVYGQEAAEAGRQTVAKSLLNRFMAWVRSFRKGV